MGEDWKRIQEDLRRFSLIFVEALKMLENCTKRCFTFFAFLPPLYRCFRLSRASQTIDLEEIYRLVSKNLNFPPCGSVLVRFRQMFDRCSIDARQMFDRCSIGVRQMFDRCSIDVRQMFDRCSIDVRQMFGGRLIDVRQMFDRCSVDVRQVFDVCPVDVRQTFDRCSIDVRQMFGRCSIDVRQMFHIFPTDVREMFNRCSMGDGWWVFHRRFSMEMR